MDISERVPGDLDRLRRLARRATKAEQKDRLLAVAHAISGRETQDIQDSIGRSRGFVQRWVYVYRDRGIDAIRDTRRGGRKPVLPVEAHERLRARLDAGPTESDGVCTLRGKDVQRIVAREFGVKLSLTSAYRLLHRLGYRCLAPRPRHEHQDLDAQAEFKRVAPLLFTGSDA